MKCFLQLLFLAFAHAVLAQTASDRYPVRELNRWGFIDGTGKMIIPATYHAAAGFQEGLAAVRKGGYYGYINSAGLTVIPFLYDYAESFQDSTAIVYKSGRPLLIDRSGRTLFGGAYISMSTMPRGGRWMVAGASGAFGIADRSGRLLVDTQFFAIYPHASGTASLVRMLENEKEVRSYRAALVDSAGRYLIPFGRYSSISCLRDGYYAAQLMKGPHKGDAEILDPALKVQMVSSNDRWYSEATDFRPDGTEVAIRKQTPKKEKHNYDSYVGVVDRRGRVLFSDTSWCSFIPFSEGRAFAGYSTEGRSWANRWILIDRQGRRIGNRNYQEVLYDEDGKTDAFINGVAFVRNDEEDTWTAIDTSGSELTRPLHLRNFGKGGNVQISHRIGHCVVLKEYRGGGNDGAYYYGLWDTRRNKVMQPAWQRLDWDTIPGRLSMAITASGAMSYLDADGETIWEAAAIPIPPQPLHIDCMNRGYCYASGPKRADLAGLGGWGGSHNEALKLEGRGAERFEFLWTDTAASWHKDYLGQKVYLRNGTGDTVYFPAQDSRLYMKVEAQDEAGQWRDIEYLPSSWCGNSYHTLALPPAHSWGFVVPVYEGSLKTKMRISVLYQKGTNRVAEGQELVLYSNVREGSVNPGQFWRKRGYTPGGMMDPYND